MARARIITGLFAAAALAAGPARADDPQCTAAEQGSRGEHPTPLDIGGRLRADANGVSLEVGGTRVELRINAGQLARSDSRGAAAAGAHELDASITIDGKTTNLQLRIVPPSEDAPAREK